MNRREAILTFAGLFAQLSFGKIKMEKSKKMPVMFIGHGSPMNAIEDNDYTKTLVRLGKDLPKPRAILMISAHWETNGTWLTSADQPKTIHDFYGFPKELDQIQYSAPGNKGLAFDLNSKGIGKLDDGKWGLDHGSWSILKHMYPEANIPVIQLSLDMTKPLSHHYELGQKIKELREHGVLIIGSGNVVHNLKELNWSANASSHDWARDFDLWVKENLKKRDFEALVKRPFESEVGKRSHPSIEHYLPLLYVIGASDSSDNLKFDYEGIQNASISMLSVRFES